MERRPGARSFMGLARDFAVVSDQIHRRRGVSKRAEKARDLSAMVRAVIDDMQHDLPQRRLMGIALQILIRDFAANGIFA